MLGCSQGAVSELVPPEDKKPRRQNPQHSLPQVVGTHIESYPTRRPLTRVKTTQAFKKTPREHMATEKTFPVVQIKNIRWHRPPKN